jgi:sugar lactone lactonase YvrE
MRAEPITGPDAFHGEGPVWWEDWGGLRFVDLFAGDVLTLAGNGVERRHVGTVAAALRPRRDGGAVLALERSFALEEADGALTVLPDVWNDATIRFNEGGCDPDGRFYCGSMAWDARPGAAALYRLDPDGSVELVLDGITISNGLEWSPDGSRVYYADTPTGRIDVFDYESASGLTNRRQFVVIPSENGFPDGLTVDADGGVWVALYGGGAVHRYDGGALDAVVDVPTPKPTACTFGGPGLTTLYVTTTRENLPPGSDPLAGALFALEPGVAGLPVRTFAG